MKYAVYGPQTSPTIGFVRRSVYMGVGLVIGILAALYIIQRSMVVVQVPVTAQPLTTTELHNAYESGGLTPLSGK